MKTVIKDEVIYVTVSRRNLLALLAKLDGHPHESFCTIIGPTMYPPTVLTAEENEQHYSDLDRLGVPQDPMHPETETLVG